MFDKFRLSGAWAAISIAAAAAGICQPALAQQSVADFYKGKSIDLIIGYSPGGGYDLYARTVAQVMSKHIPGNPNIVPRNMPGAGSLVAAKWVYSVAPKDGTVLATADQALPTAQAMGDKTVSIDTSKLIYIGNPNADNNTTVTWYTSGVKTVEDAKQKEIVIGATGDKSTSAQYPWTMNAVLGTKFKVIVGYPGGNDVNLAMERGEVAGRGSNAWASWKATRPDWLKDHKINILVQIGLRKASDLPDVPLLFDLAKNDQDKALLKLISASTTIGRPLFTTPGVPKDRVDALRKAFDETMKDPEFIAAAKKQKMDLDPVSGEDLQKIVEEIVATPKPVGERLLGIINNKGK